MVLGYLGLVTLLLSKILSHFCFFNQPDPLITDKCTATWCASLTALERCLLFCLLSAEKQRALILMWKNRDCSNCRASAVFVLLFGQRIMLLWFPVPFPRPAPTPTGTPILEVFLVYHKGTPLLSRIMWFTSFSPI